MRFNYRPANPLYLLLVRAYRLRQAVVIENTPEYAGCKSWVPLKQAMDTRDAKAVLTDETYERRREMTLGKIGERAAAGKPRRLV